MQCVTATATQRVYQKPFSVFSLIFSLPWLVIPLIAVGAIWSSQGNRFFQCFRDTRSTVNCEVTFQPLLPLPTQTQAYEDVKGAGNKTETTTDMDGDKTTYHYVTLKTVGEEVEVWSARSDSDAQALAARIQAFLKGTEGQLLVDSRGAAPPGVLLLLTLFPALFAGIGILQLFDSLCRRCVTLDRSKRQIHQKYLPPFGFRGQKTVPFGEVQRVAVQVSQDSDGDPIFRVEVQGRSPSSEPLLTLHFLRQEAAARTEAEQLGQFLGCAVALPETLASAASAEASADTESRPELERAARQIQEVLEVNYAPEHEWVRVNAQDLAHLNLSFYDRARKELEKLGFRYLGDAENRTLTRLNPASRTFVRLMVSRDGRILAGIYALPGPGFLKPLQWLGMFPKMEVVELDSELSDGSFLTTSPTLGLVNPEPIPELLFKPYDPKTPLPDLVKFHTQELAQRAPAQAVTSYEEAVRLQHRLQACRSRHKPAKFTAADVQRYAKPGQQAWAQEVGKVLETMGDRDEPEPPSQG